MKKLWALIILNVLLLAYVAYLDDKVSDLRAKNARLQELFDDTLQENVKLVDDRIRRGWRVQP